MKKTWTVPSVECLNVSETQNGLEGTTQLKNDTLNSFNGLKFVNQRIVES